MMTPDMQTVSFAIAAAFLAAAVLMGGTRP